jgi:hypothetical protein
MNETILLILKDIQGAKILFFLELIIGHIIDSVRTGYYVYRVFH